jgi:dipeptidyl aminopeptidase/acylaminoacyl peptidase
MFTRCSILALVLAVSPSVVLAQALASDKITLETYLELETVSDPRVSPDGAQIIYTRQWIDKINDRRESSLWIMNADGTRNRFLIDGSNARWSPTGDRIAFTAPGKPRGTQVFVRWMDMEGATSQITHLEESPSNIAWSPDGTQIAFSMLVEENNTWPIKMPKAPDGARWTESPKIVERLRFRQDRVGYTDTGYRHLFTVPAEGGSARQITRGTYEHTTFEWTPDGKALVFSSLHADNAEQQFRESEIYRVDVASGVVTQLTRRKGPDTNPAVSPDGTKIAYTGYDWTRDSWIDSKLYVMNADGSDPRLVSGDWDRSPQDLTWAPDSSGVYFTAQTEGHENLYFLRLGGAVQPVTKGVHMLSVSDITPKGKAVGTLTSFYKPADIVSFELRTPGEIKQLTSVNDDILAGKRLGKVEEIWYQAPDGVRVQGWYMTPPDFDPSRKYPLQLHIHGGPHSMYGTGFNIGWQEMAANGYVILYTNPRGSTGYGSKFGNMIADSYPGPDYDDLMAGVDTMLKKGFVDASNLFVTGCSGGGILTAWIVTKTDRFAAAASNCTIVEWMSLAGTTDGPFSYYRFPKFFWEDPAPWIQHSSIFHVGKVKTPTLLMTGEQDLRTPMAQAEMFYRALKFRNIPTALIRFKNEWHGTTSMPSNFLRTQLYLRHWFDKYKRAAATTTATGQ